MAIKSKKKVAKTTKKATPKIIKKAAKKAVKKAAAAKPAPKVFEADKTVASKSATITVTFTGVAVGNSQITASLNGKDKSRTSSGKINFSKVERDDIIGIDGSSPGKTKVEINIDATPTEFNFTGNFNDNFIIN